MPIPRSYCDPPTAFGKVKDVTERVWTPPCTDDPTAVAKFRAAVMQNLICCYVRTHKNAVGLPQEQLALRDPRPDSVKMWGARLNGRANLTAQDIVTLMMILPGVMPPESEVKEFIEVVEKRIKRPSHFSWPDS